MKMLVGGGRGVGRVLTGAMSIAMRGISTIVGGDILRDVATFVQSLDSMFGGFQERADRTYALLKQSGTEFVVVAAPNPTRCARRRSSWNDCRRIPCRWPG